MFENVVADSWGFAFVMLGDSVGPHDMSKIAASYSTMLLEANPALERRFIDSMGCASMTVKMTLFEDMPSFVLNVPLGTVSPMQLIGGSFYIYSLAIYIF